MFRRKDKSLKHKDKLLKRKRKPSEKEILQTTAWNQWNSPDLPWDNNVRLREVIIVMAKAILELQGEVGPSSKV